MELWMLGAVAVMLVITAAGTFVIDRLDQPRTKKTR